MDYFIGIEYIRDGINWLTFGWAPEDRMSNIDKTMVSYGGAKGFEFAQDKWSSFYGATISVTQSTVFAEKEEAQKALFKLVFFEE